MFEGMIISAAFSKAEVQIALSTPNDCAISMEMVDVML
jgi:hypothetical protein